MSAAERASAAATMDRPNVRVPYLFFSISLTFYRKVKTRSHILPVHSSAQLEPIRMRFRMGRDFFENLLQ